MGFRFWNLSSSVYRASVSRTSPDADRILRHGRVIRQHLRPHLRDPSFGGHYDVPRRWHLGHSHHDHDRRPFSAGEDGVRIFRLGLAADVCLAAGKAVTGYLSGSTAIIADAAHSVSDVVLSGVALWSYKAANVPKDKDHPYGHGKFETLGALGISCMLLATAGGIAWHALDLLLGLLSATPEIVNHSVLNEHVHSHHHGGHHHGVDMEHPILALSVTIISISTKEGLYWITKRAGERQGSGLMKANAWHHRADAISSVVALLGVGGSILGIKFLDPLAGLVVSGMIFKAGLETGHQSILELVDAAIPAEDLDPIKETILKVEGVKGCHRLRGRRAGSSLYLDVHIEVDPFVSVSAAHGIGETVRHQIHESHPEVTEVFIHIDPSISQFSPTKMDEQKLSEGLVVPNRNNCVDDKAIEAVVHNAVSSKLSKQMVVERITHHVLQGKVLLEVEVSMPPEMLIRDAMEVAKEAEEQVLKTDTNIVHVSFQLSLGRRIPRCDDDLEEMNQK
ncbi:metal tolerance protein 2 [Eucalyptus grandis]|uniref:metal tolerance protein 2 n=1 Tax=Eucalyptus grandis TaxID=71139 RepID=UPI00192EA640|nr:metal tolerance protein 2 [Eucalyptus grandis]